MCALIAFIIISNHHLSDVELAFIRSASDDTMMYIEQIVDSDGDENDRYIAYALTYAQNERDVTELTADEIQNIVQDRFNVEITSDEINDVGITAYLFDKQISHRPEEKVYTLNAENLSQSQIAKIPITKYVIKHIGKAGGNYFVEYEKYVVDNPYSILDYYQKQTESLPDEERAANPFPEASGVYKYLVAEGKIKDIKTAINKDNIESIGRIDGSLKVTYIVKNDKLLVDKIEKIEQ